VPSSLGARRSTSHDRLRLPLDLGIRSKHTQEAPYPSPPMSHSPPPPGPSVTTPGDERHQHGVQRGTFTDDNRLPHGPQQQQSQSVPPQGQYLYHQGNRISTPLSTVPPPERSAESYVGVQYTAGGDSVSSQIRPPPPPPDGRSQLFGPPMQQQQQTFMPQQHPSQQQNQHQTQQAPPRRPKSHVASACVNCKRAHLACDSTFSRI
jgi:hypothetical protein